MRKLFLLLFLFALYYNVQAQTNIPVADLLDLKFSSQGQAKDISQKQFTVKTGSTVPTTKFDAEIKQYVSSFPQNSSLNRYFMVDYKNDTDFKNKIQGPFTIEIYTKTTSSAEVTSVGSMRSGGFGFVQSTTTGITEFRMGKPTSGYSVAGDVDTYNEIKQEYYHMTFTYDGSNLKSYYNGVYKNNIPNVQNMRLSSDKAGQWIAIGGDVAGSTLEQSFKGEIAIVRMYSKALSDTEVSTLYSQIQNREALSNADLLNKLLTITLPGYADQTKAKQYIEEGWQLMQSFSTTEQDINNYKAKVVANLGITVPETSDYPRFAVMSDLHLGSTGYVDPEGKVTKAIKILKDQNPKLDAIFVVGDVVNNGTASQLSSAVKLFSDISTITPVYYSMGNHEWWEGNGDIFRSVIGQRLNQFVEIKGYPFIMVSLDNKEGEPYRSASKAYLDAALKRASTEYPGKPIFLYMHVPMENTVYGTFPIPPGTSNRSENSTAAGLPNIISNYPQVILFSGHSHMPVADERCIYQGKYTAIHNGAVVNVRSEDGTVEDTWPIDNGKASAGCIVSIDKNSDVTVKRFDILRNEEIKQPWVIKAPHDGSQFVYTKYRTGGEYPYFKSTDKISVSDINSNACKITFPQANDDDLVHHYIIRAYDKSEKQTLNVTIFSRFYLGSQMPTSLSWDITGLKTDADYKFEVRAVDSFGNTSDPLVVNRINTDVQNIYLTGSATSCGWTSSNPLEMKPTATEGVFTWEGTLKAGEFKFLSKKGTWNPSINPLKTQSVSSGVTYSINMTNGVTGDYKFTTSREMYCVVTVDTKNWTTTITEDTSVKNIYLTGSAMSCGWTNTSPIAMTPTGTEGVFIWEGTVKAGEFKFLLKKGSWMPSVNPLKTQSVSSDVSYNLNITNGSNDYKFTTSKEMSCVITVDTKNWTTIISEKTNSLRNATSIPAISNNQPLTIIQREGKVEVTCNQGIMSYARLLNTNGVTLDIATKKSNMFYLGNSLSNGIYIVEVLIDGQRFVQKVAAK